MMKSMVCAALMAGATLAHGQSSPAKKELAQKLVLAQQPVVEGIARQIVERPAMQVMQAAGNALQTQVAPEKREAMAKTIEADVKKFVEDATPLLRERAMKLAPTTYGAQLEEKFTEDELKQMLAWLDSPVNKKLQQLGPEMQTGFTQKLVAEAAPLIDPKLQALQQKIRGTLGLPPVAAGASGPAPTKAPAPARPASK